MMHAGQAGDLADAKGPAGNRAKWLPRKGVLTWQHVPGHAPGQVSHTFYPLSFTCSSFIHI